MTRLIIRRVLSGIVVLWVVVTLVFAINFMIPSDPARAFAGHQATPETLAAVRRTLFLDQPIWVQYGHFWDQVVHGTLISFVNHTSVMTLVGAAVPVTVSLLLGGAVLWMAMGVGIGIIAARRPRSFIDRTTSVIALFFYSIPPFVIGVVLLYLLFFEPSVHGMSLFPPGGYVPLSDGILPWAHALVLPWITLALTNAATYSRLTRSSLLDVLGEDYIRTARAKGLSERRVVYRHGLRSALSPLLSQFGIDVATVLGTSIVVEMVFGLNGLGRLAVRSITVTHDLPVVMGIVVVAAAFIVAANIVVDILYAVIDPRVRAH